MAKAEKMGVVFRVLALFFIQLPLQEVGMGPSKKTAGTVARAVEQVEEQYVLAEVG